MQPAGRPTWPVRVIAPRPARGAPRPLRGVAVVLGLAVLVAQLAVVVFSPREGVLEPDGVRASAYFTAQELGRATAFREPQLWLALAQQGLGLALLAAVVMRPPRRLRRHLAGGDHVLLRVAVAAGALSLVLTAAGLPLAAVARIRAVDVGLVTGSWAVWSGDVLLGAVTRGGFAAVIGVVLLALMRRSSRWWWLPASGFVLCGAVVVLYVTPVVIDPLYNRFTPVTGQARADAIELADRAGVDVGAVLAVDASRRTSAANAYVAGLGRTKRVVLYDNLLERFPREERRFVIAHELAHQHYDDLPRGLLYLALVAPFGLVAVGRLVRTLTPRDGGSPALDARAVPALALSLAIVVPLLTTVSNQLSRRVEARADVFALQLTDAPQALIDFRRRSVVQNVSDPDPPKLARWLFGTHPSAVERIGTAEAWLRGERP